MAIDIKKGNSKKLVIGAKAPPFSLLDENGNKRSLSEFYGYKVVVYFYPKDDTPGCTRQACELRNSFDLFTKNKVKVIGISYDTPASHKLFKEKNHLPFVLLSDLDKSVSELYGTYRGWLRAWFPSRTTFLINEKGIIIDIIEHVNVASHVPDIIKRFNFPA